MISNDWRSQIFKKKLGARIWGQNQAQNEVFRHYLEFGSLVFLNIRYSDSLKQYLTSSRGETYEKSFWGQNLRQTSQNRAQNYVFCHFFKFDSLVFLEVAYSDSLQQCLTSARGKTHEKCLGTQFWAKIGPEICFFAIFSSLAH